MNKTPITLLSLISMLLLSPLSFGQDDAVDYADIDNWLCHPDNAIDLCDQDLSATIISPDGSLTIEPWEAHPNPPIDCFYVYPTTSLDQATFSDLKAGRNEEIITAFTQAAHFKSQCRMFAPMYRQITIQALLSNIGSLAGNDQLNYLDVLAAFNHYMENYNEGRGFVLIGHSQGTSLLIELMRNEIDGKPVQEQLVSAILAGNPVIVPKGEDVGGTFQNIPLCRANDQIGCAINFMTYRDTIPPEGFAIFGRAPDDQTQAGCTNPANLAGGSGELDAYLSNIGEIVQAVAPMPNWTNPPQEITTRFVKVPGLLSARCVNTETFNYLEMSVNADPNDARTDNIRGDLYQGSQISAVWGLHLIDMTITQGNLVAIVGEQAQAYANK
ncbi:MAG: lysophospholipase [SAR86 cluster bacterium]|uniref:Lysophospholipase n=1 Tax=SAR86 cluster bacterium TaxID=2030880 RepID=A0A2A5AUM6_9GAMM|nr:MAG: lysophospholipase [SAR86 cluster bacterium]